MQRKFKLLTIIVTSALVAALVMASAGPAIGAWIDNNVVNIVSAPATSSFTTEVVGVSTNAFSNPIDINGQYYSAPGGVAPKSIASYDSGPISGDPNNPSVASITASGFVPNDYVEFQVTITNTGSTTLAFSPTYTILDQFVNGAGTPIGYVFPANDPYNANYADQTKTVPVVHQWTIGDWGTDSLATYQTFLTNNALVGCASTWCQDNAMPAGTVAMPATLASGASFVYIIYTGLGAQTISGIPACHYQISISLTVAN